MDSHSANTRKLRRGLSWTVVLFLGVTLIWWLRADHPVEVKVAQAEKVGITGSFTAEAYVRGREYVLSSVTGGRIVRLLAREGDRVRRGDVLLSVDAEDARRALLEAEAATKVAELEAIRALASLTAGKVELAHRIRSAEAGVSQADASLRRARTGVRIEEIRQAESRLEKANAVLSDADKTLARTRQLVAEGALPRATLDAAESRHASASADVSEAAEYLAMLRAGPRAEDVAIAERQMDTARAQLAEIKSGSSQIEPLRLQVAAAKATVARLRATEMRLRETIERTDLRAPVDGIVTKLNVEEGATAIAGGTAITISTREDLRIEAEIGSEDAGKIREGMPVQVTSPAYPGQTFNAKLVSALPVGELKPDAAIRTRIVRARVRLESGWDLFRPGMEVDVEGTVALKTALCVPSDAIHVLDQGIGVFVVENSRARWKPVRVGYTTASQAEIMSGIAPGDRVVIQGKDGLTDGTVVKVVP